MVEILQPLPEFAEPRWLAPALQALAELPRLEADWDGYGSPPVRPAALQAARRLVEILEAFPLPDPHICSVTGGGIGFYWQDGPRELEILPDGSARYQSETMNDSQSRPGNRDDYIVAQEEGDFALSAPESARSLARRLVGG